MSYVEKILTTDEKITTFHRFHWFYVMSPLIASFIFFLGAVKFASDYYIGEFSIAPLFIAVVIFYLLRFIRRLIEMLTTEQVLTNKRVFIKKGFISRDTDELFNEKIETVSIRQTVLGRLLNFGDINFTGTGGVHINLTWIPNPTEVKKKFGK